jgi:sulfide:quinone oxidoreductase
MDRKFGVLIIGGGAGGLTVAAHLRNEDPAVEIAVIEPAEKHYYQPLWTLVGGGVFPREESEREEKDFIPPGVSWVRDRVASLDPERKTVATEGGETIGYDFLVISAGMQLDWEKIPGLRESVGRAGTGVCSNYSYETVNSTWEAIRSFRGGTALFTEPTTPVKCGGAPQKIMYLADDAFRRAGIRDRCRIAFLNGKATLFTSPYYTPAIAEICRTRDLEVHLKHDLRELRPAAKEAVFANLETGEEVVMKYDMIHVTPPMSAPDFIKRSPLANADGWVEVDKHTLRHVRVPNVFSLGDCSSLPTSKTGAAIRKQAPVLVENLRAALEGRDGAASYDGYTSCPVVTGYGKLILAEFDYDKNPVETFPFDQSRERYSMYAIKAYALPRIYWHGMLRGRA